MKYFIVYTLCLILFTACTKEKIEVPDTGRKIVINGLITTDSLFNVSLTQSGILTDRGNYQHADLRFNTKIYENNVLVDSSLYGFTYPDGYYGYLLASDYGSRKVIPFPGNEYKIVANAAGLPEASATTKIPNLVKISFIDTLMTEVYKGYITCNVQITDPPDEKNYYMLMVKRKVYNIHTRGIPEIEFDCTDPIIEEKLMDGGTIGIAFSDKIINGKKHKIPIKIGQSAFGYPFLDDREVTTGHGPTIIGPPIKKTFYFRLYSITEDFYKYIRTLNLYGKNFGNPLTDPVLMHSNVNGGLGIFAGAAVSVDSLVYDYSKQ